jgi:hypothetical protein
MGCIFMDMRPSLSIGDIIKLKPKYYRGCLAMIITIHESSASMRSSVGGEWISFDIEVITDNNLMIHVSDDCIDFVVSRIAE